MTTAMVRQDDERKYQFDVTAAVADGADWRTFARCQDEPNTFVINYGDDEDEPSYPTAAQSRCCALCPVRTECLNYALDADEAAGVWGGMTTYQRRMLRRVQSRKSCPGCGSSDIIVEGSGRRQHEVCLSCAVSWST